MTKQERQIQALLNKFAPIVAREFNAAMKRAASSIDFDALVLALKAGNVDRALELIKIAPEHLFAVEAALTQVRSSAGQAISGDLPRAIKGVFSFDGKHARAVSIAEQQSAAMITAVSENSIKSARGVIVESLKKNTPAEKIARDLVGKMANGSRSGGFLGLTEPQAESIRGGRRKLSSGQPSELRKYLKLKQRDSRHDKLIKRAIKEGKPISASKIEEILRDHKNKALIYRGRQVARTEVRMAQATGREEGYRQVFERSDVESVSKRWQHNDSVNPREDHKAMDGTVLSSEESFVFTDTTMAHSHDPKGGAEHNVGCHCTTIYRVRMKR